MKFLSGTLFTAFAQRAFFLGKMMNGSSTNWFIKGKVIFFHHESWFGSRTVFEGWLLLQLKLFQFRLFGILFLGCVGRRGTIVYLFITAKLIYQQSKAHLGMKRKQCSTKGSARRRNRGKGVKIESVYLFIRPPSRSTEDIMFMLLELKGY